MYTLLDRAIPLAVLTAAIGWLAVGDARGQMMPNDRRDFTITPEIRGKVIDGVLKQLGEHYIFPDKAKAMEQAVRLRQEKKEYDEITSAKVLAEKLTKDLREVTHDKHLHVIYSYAPLPRPHAPSAEDMQRMRTMMGQRNFGFEKVERLEGNIGYLDLRSFADADAAGETAAAAMGFLANTDALIIDVRKNGGGSPSMVALLCSYLFDGRPRHLNSLAHRTPEGEELHQWWTLPYVPGKRYAGKDVYVLTSSYTFSAAEEFTYNLQTQKRATIVGATTGGGAHPGGAEPVTEHFALWVPTGRAINPITKTNWEGTGVKPDVAVPAERALDTAHLAALKNIQHKLAGESAQPVDERRLKDIKQVIERLENKLKPEEKAGRS